jgi:mRNA interferase RelE/StbE
MSTPEIFTVLLTKRAQKETHKLDRSILARVVRAIDGLETNPRPHGCLQVKTQEGLWRIRVGDWRIGYEIEHFAWDESRPIFERWAKAFSDYLDYENKNAN